MHYRTELWGWTPKFVRTLGLKIFNVIVRSDTPGYEASDRTLGLNTIVRTNFGVENFQTHSLTWNIHYHHHHHHHHHHQQQHIIINSSSISIIIITTINIIITIIISSSSSSSINIIISSSYYYYPPPKAEGYRFSIFRPCVRPCVRPGKYLQFHWTEFRETSYMCTITYSAGTLFLFDAKWPTGSDFKLRGSVHFWCF